MKLKNIFLYGFIFIIVSTSLVVLTGYTSVAERPENNIYTFEGTNYSAVPNYDIINRKSVTSIDLTDYLGKKLSFDEYLYGKHIRTSKHFVLIRLNIYSDSFIENGIIEDDDIIEIEYHSFVNHGGLYKFTYEEFKNRLSIPIIWDRNIVTNEIRYSHPFATYYFIDIIDIVRKDMHPNKHNTLNNYDEMMEKIKTGKYEIYKMENNTTIPMDTWVYLTVNEENKTINYIIKE